MDISEPESGGLGFQDIEDFASDTEAGDLSPVEKLGNRLADHLIQFQGCCRGCHEESEREDTVRYSNVMHYSLQDVIDDSRDSSLPDVLSSVHIARHQENLAALMTTAQKRWTFSGINPDREEEGPGHICLQEDETPCRMPRAALDIDSITGFCSSLAVAKGGLRWNSMQMPVSDLQSGLHLAKLRVYYSDSHGHRHSILVPINEAPHYTAGRLVMFEDVSVYFLFPRLYRENQQSSRLLDDDFKAWTDRVLTPAINRHHDSGQTQHYPSTFYHGRYNSTARGVEGRSRKVDTVAREQQLMHFLPPEKLHAVWETIQELVGQPGLQQFKDVTIFVHAKNLKTLIRDTTWAGMMARLGRYWGTVVDEDYISSQLYFDLGLETYPGQDLSAADPDSPAETLLWKRCCLESFHSWLRAGDEAAACRQTVYPAALLQDSVSMGIEPGSKSQLRAAGLLYAQFYSSVKEVFAAGNQYPFTNTAIETLALDPQLQKTWQHVGAGLSHDPVALIKAYLYAKARCHHGIGGSLGKSFGTRQEFRVAADLLAAIGHRFAALGLDEQEIAPARGERPYVTHLTTTVLGFYRWNINKFCAGFEMVYSLGSRQWVTWEHTRIMLMFLRCLRFSYGGGRPQEAAGCWRDIRHAPSRDSPGGFRRTEGLGFQVTMPRHGYAWFLEKMDWETMTFRAPHGQYMLFNNVSMQQAYRARYGQVRDVRDDFIRVSKIHQLMQEFRGRPQCQAFLQDTLRQICLCAFRKDVFQHIKHLIKKECVEDALAGRIPLCWPSVDRALRPQCRPLCLVSGARLAVQSIEVLFTWLWGRKADHFERKHWEDKPYRLLYWRSFELIQLEAGHLQARAWKRKLMHSFIRSHWLLPYPQGDRFMKSQKSRPYWWSSYHAGVDMYYQAQAQEGRGTRARPLPAGHIGHYPLEGWGLSATPGGYMPYEVEPEHDLADLSEGEVYERAVQLAQAPAAADDGLGASEVDVYCREPTDPAQIDKVKRAQQELDKARERVRSLRYRRRPRLARLDQDANGRHEEEGGLGEETESDEDEDELDLLVEQQEDLVWEKEEELATSMKERAAELERERELRVLEEMVRWEQRQRESDARAAELERERDREMERQVREDIVKWERRRKEREALRARRQREVTALQWRALGRAQQKIQEQCQQRALTSDLLTRQRPRASQAKPEIKVEEGGCGFVGRPTLGRGRGRVVLGPLRVVVEDYI
jgi:hypothetical protein